MRAKSSFEGRKTLSHEARGFEVRRQKVEMNPRFDIAIK
jgi:hypothetical protein